MLRLVTSPAWGNAAALSGSGLNHRLVHLPGDVWVLLAEAWSIGLYPVKWRGLIVDVFGVLTRRIFMAAASVEQTRRRSGQADGAAMGDGLWRILIRSYDTRTFTHDLAREIRLVTGRTRWQACQITAGIVAGHDEMCLMDGLNDAEAERTVQALSTAGFMARRERGDGIDTMPASLPGMRTVLSGFIRR